MKYIALILLASALIDLYYSISKIIKLFPNAEALKLFLNVKYDKNDKYIMFSFLYSIFANVVAIIFFIIFWLYY